MRHDGRVHLTVNGVEYDLEVAAVITALHAVEPEKITMHWVEVSGVRYPVKQALEATLGVDRHQFRSHTARRQFRRLGFEIGSIASEYDELDEAAADVTSPVTIEQAGEAFATLVEFLRGRSFTTRIAELEHQLLGAESSETSRMAERAGLTTQLLQAALIVRRDVGRVSDVIHASAILLALPTILEPGEVISNRPSLGPGNDKTRPFDLETDRRVAEFKVALWSGGDMMRKRGVTADLVHLALDESGRRPELWVAGEEPLRFMDTSVSSVADLLTRSSRHLRERYTGRFGTKDIPLYSFVREQAAHVQRRNIATVLPEIA